MATLTACTVSPCSLSRKHTSSFLPNAARFHSNKLHTQRLPFNLPTPCRKGQLQRQVTAVEPNRPGCAPPASPDISMLSPELQQQWHLSANMHLGAIKVKPGSAVKAVWQCDKCPAEQPHVWKAVVASRTRGSKCPYCSSSSQYVSSVRQPVHRPATFLYHQSRQIKP
ncbi:hypothetical protein ABBQ38_001899 [Trebouxia sp. C0009 RCD-2024]